MIRANVILAVTKRNFSSYFSSVLGYLFMVVFCVAASAMAFNSAFFAANQANLDQLSSQFPLLLLFLIPAIAMTTWSDERKLGTDELLFTMPATELEILIGKYLAVVCVYTVALLLSLVNVVLLKVIAQPDFGLLFSSYFGYWISGSCLLAIAMIASAITESATVAFVLGVVFCCVPVFIGNAVGVIEWVTFQFGSTERLYELRDTMDRLSLQSQLRDFSLGVISLNSFCYFALLTGVALYMNLVVISKRRWSSGTAANMTLHYGLRTLCLLAIFASVLVVTSVFPARKDMTAERLFSLSDATYETLKGVEGQKITIQAFVSPEVPREYSETRRRLLGLLREFQARSGGNIEYRQVDVKPYSPEAEQARALGVTPATIQYREDGRTEETEVFMGVVIQSATDTVELPFIDRGIPVEYELTRSVRTVSQDGRLTIGVLQTDANVAQAGGRQWQIVTELKKQYDVINVNPSQKILVEEGAEDEADDEEDSGASTEDFDMLLAVMPSSLTQPEMDNFLEYVKAGRPTLIFDDVMPYFNPGLAPRLPKPSPGGGMMMMQRQQPDPKADNGTLSTLMRLMEIEWENGTAVYDKTQPHSEFSYLPPEIFFVSRSGNPKEAFNSESPITAGLQDVVVMFPGEIKGFDSDGDKIFRPLLQTSGESGQLKWEKFTEANPMAQFMGGPPLSIRRNISRNDDKWSHILAAHVINTSEEKPLNVIFCADTDMIGDQFFSLRASQALDVEFDNVTFVLNAVDTLVGDEVFINLRSRRPAMRTLAYVEDKTRELQKTLSAEETAAEKEVDKRVEEARKELQAEIDELEDNTDLDPQSKGQLIAQKTEQLNKRINDEERELRRQTGDRVRAAGVKMRREIQQVQNRVKIFAWVLPAILPVCFGLLFLGIRNLSEQKSISSERRRR